MATETAIDVVMPQMGVSVSEGTITRWLKQEGEHVDADEPLLEISTDKVDTEVPDGRYTTPIGKARVHQTGTDVSVVTWGAMVYTAEEAAQQLGDVSVEIVDLRTVMPWDKAAVLESVRKTSKVLVLHEDTRTGGFGAEIAATIAEEAFEDLDAPVKRIAAPDTPVPFSPPLEKAFIPQVEDVVAGLRELEEY